MRSLIAHLIKLLNLNTIDGDMMTSVKKSVLAIGHCGSFGGLNLQYHQTGAKTQWHETKY